MQVGPWRRVDESAVLPQLALALALSVASFPLQLTLELATDMLAALDFCDDGTLPSDMAWIPSYNRKQK